MVNQQPFWFGQMTLAEAKRWQRPKAVISICAICGVIFGLQWFLPELPVYSLFTFEWPEGLAHLYRVITPIFLHFSILHIVFNLSMFWFFGRQVETLMGSKVLIAIVFISAIISNLGQAMAQGTNFGGLSGVVMAVIGFVWMASMSEKGRRFYIPRGLVVILLATIVIGFTGLLDAILGPVANVAHGVGFATGVVLWPFIAAFLPKEPRE